MYLLNKCPCQARSTLVDINSDEILFYPFTVSINKWGGSCNAIDDPYAWVCVSNKVKNVNAKIFNQMSWVNDTIKILYYDRIGVSEGINVNKTSASKECII